MIIIRLYKLLLVLMWQGLRPVELRLNLVAWESLQGDSTLRESMLRDSMVGETVRELTDGVAIS